MFITRECDYAVRVVRALWGESRLSVSDICEKESVTAPFAYKILKKLQKHGITIFMISHDVEFVAEYADRVGLFFQGNVVTSKPAGEFFAGNSFYTTAANRMARHYFPEAVTGKEVAACLKERL